MTGRYTTPATPQPKSFTSKQSYSGLRSKRSMASSSSSSSSRSSKVLAALDTSERMACPRIYAVLFLTIPRTAALSMRAEMNRILTLPDFAGLSQKRSTFSDSRSIAPKRRLSSISVDWDEDHKVKVRRFLHKLFLKAEHIAEASAFYQPCQSFLCKFPSRRLAPLE